MEENIRKLLIFILVTEPKNLVKNINAITENSFLYPLLLCYLEGESDKSDADNMIIQNHSDMPYFIWSNKVVFEFFKKPKHISSTIEYFYGFSEMINLKEYFEVSKFEKMKVCILLNENRRKLILNTVEELAHRNMNNMKMIFNDACKKLLNRNATTEEKNKFGFYYSRLSTEKFHNNLNEPIIKAILATFNIPDE